MLMRYLRRANQECPDLIQYDKKYVCSKCHASTQICSILCLISSNKMGYETRKIRNVVLLYQKYFLISILCNILIVPFYAQLKPHVDICMKITKCYGTQRDIVSLNHIIILFQSDLLPEECQNFHLYTFHRNTFTFGIETYGWFRRVWITYWQFYKHVIVLS